MRKTILRSLAAAVCLTCTMITGWAAEPEHRAGPKLPAGITGICITGVPEAREGLVKLEDRILKAGDILTADQASRMTFCPGTRQGSSLHYLPIGRDGVRAVETLILGKPRDQAPEAEDSTLQTYKNLPNTGRLKASDPEQQPLTYRVVRQPRRGTVTLEPDGSFTYTPKRNKVGTDSFRYTAADPQGNLSREATVTVEILKSTDAPQYVDTAGKSCSFAAEWMKHTGLFVGETLDGSPCFQPDRPVTRGEFLTVLVKTMKLPPEPDLELRGMETRVPAWFRPYLAAALRSGLTAGLPHGDSLEADQEITGAEAAVLLQGALELPVSALAARETSGPDWARGALAALEEKGFPLDAEAPLTRSQAAELFWGLRDSLSPEP